MPPTERRTIVLTAVVALLLGAQLTALVFAVDAALVDDPDRPPTPAALAPARVSLDGPAQGGWNVTSGSLFFRQGAGWTGPPDGEAVDDWSDPDTGSAVFRATLEEPEMRTGELAFTFAAHRFVHTERTPEQDWDGIHAFVRWQDEHTFYSVSVLRRDGTVVLKKKLPGEGANGGVYTTLASEEHSVDLEQHHEVRIAVTQAPGRVEFDVWIDGRRALSGADDGSSGRIIASPGRVGLRGDNIEFAFTDVSVNPEQGNLPGTQSATSKRR